MVGFLKKIALNSTAKEIQDYNEWLESLGDEELTKVFIFTIWTRAIMSRNGYFKYPDGNPHYSADLINYPFMHEEFEKISKHFSQQGREAESNFFLIWIYTLKAFMYGEPIELEVNRMWEIIAKTKDQWEEELLHAKNQELKGGANPDSVDEIFDKASEMIKRIPPSKET